MGESLINTPGKEMPLLRPGYQNNCEGYVLKTQISRSQEMVYGGGAGEGVRIRGAPGSDPRVESTGL